MKAILGIGAFVLAIWLAMCLLAGQASAQYPYSSGYWGLTNAYWHADYYADSWQGEIAGANYYQIYSPWNSYYGQAIYDQGNWAYQSRYGSAYGYGQGYSQNDPYHNWPR